MRDAVPDSAMRPAMPCPIGIRTRWAIFSVYPDRRPHLKLMPLRIDQEQRGAIGSEQVRTRGRKPRSALRACARRAPPGPRPRACAAARWRAARLRERSARRRREWRARSLAPLGARAPAGSRFPPRGTRRALDRDADRADHLPAATSGTATAGASVANTTPSSHGLVEREARDALPPERPTPSASAVERTDRPRVGDCDDGGGGAEEAASWSVTSRHLVARRRHRRLRPSRAGAFSRARAHHARARRAAHARPPARTPCRSSRAVLDLPGASVAARGTKCEQPEWALPADERHQTGGLPIRSHAGIGGNRRSRPALEANHRIFPLRTASIARLAPPSTAGRARRTVIRVPMLSASSEGPASSLTRCAAAASPRTPRALSDRDLCDVLDGHRGCEGRGHRLEADEPLGRHLACGGHPTRADRARRARAPARNRTRPPPRASDRRRRTLEELRRRYAAPRTRACQEQAAPDRRRSPARDARPARADRPFDITGDARGRSGVGARLAGEPQLPLGRDIEMARRRVEGLQRLVDDHGGHVRGLGGCRQRSRHRLESSRDRVPSLYLGPGDCGSPARRAPTQSSGRPVMSNGRSAAGQVAASRAGDRSWIAGVLVGWRALRLSSPKLLERSDGADRTRRSRPLRAGARARRLPARVERPPQQPGGDRRPAPGDDRGARDGRHRPGRDGDRRRAGHSWFRRDRRSRRSSSAMTRRRSWSRPWATRMTVPRARARLWMEDRSRRR